MVSAAIEAVIFDLGNTLFYFDGVWPQVMTQSDAALVDALLASGLKLNRAAFQESFREELEEYYLERDTAFVEHTTFYLLRNLVAAWGYPHVSDNLLRGALAKMYAVSEAYWKIEEDALETLQALRTAGCRLGLISNAADDADVQTLIDKGGLREFFDPILTSAAVGIRKPNPRIFQMALAHWGLPPERVVVVGDSLDADIRGARNAGMRSIWITRRADTPANRARAGTIRPDAQVATLVEIPETLSRLETQPLQP